VWGVLLARVTRGPGGETGGTREEIGFRGGGGEK